MDSEEGRVIQATQEHGGFAATGKEIVKETVAILRSSPGMFSSLFPQGGPKSRMSTWDPLVYAGCLERLDDYYFAW